MTFKAAPFEYLELAKATFKYPAIDNHTHPLLKEEFRDRFSFDGLLSEAQGPALKDSVDTLACFRATKQLSQLFGCEDDWDAVKKARERIGYDGLCRKCFETIGIHCLLLDDGLDGEKICEGVSWHDKFARVASKRIVRIETVAQVRSAQSCWCFV